MQRLPRRQEESALTSLAWVRDAGSKAWRLFSGGLDGQLLEWDLQGRRPKCSTDSYGGAVWAMAPEPAQCVAAGVPNSGTILSFALESNLAFKLVVDEAFYSSTAQ